MPIAGIAGDQQAALFGQACHAPGLAKNTYGTGCFLLLNTGGNAVTSTNNLLTTVAWRRGTVLDYALEGSVFIGGAVVQWLRDGLKIIREARDIEALAASVADNGGVYLVPAFTGLGAPHWDAYARGGMFGLTRATSSGHIARAALEAIAFQSADVLAAMERDAGIRLAELRVDGGATANNLLMQFQADILGVPVVRPKVLETTALGAGYLAGLAVGYWKDAADVGANRQIDRVFEPAMPRERVAELRAHWDAAVGRVKGDRTDRRDRSNPNELWPKSKPCTPPPFAAAIERLWNMTMPTSASRADWRTPTVVLVCGGLILTVGMGIRHGFGLFLQPMSADLHWGRETFALAMAVQNLMWGATQPFAGMLADKYGTGRVVVAGAVLYILGLVAMANATTPLMLVGAGGLLIGTGLSGVTFSVIAGVLGRSYPPEKRSMVLGISAAAGSFGQFAMLPLTQWLLSHLGWYGALLTLAAVGILMVPLAAALVEKRATHATRSRSPPAKRCARRSPIGATCC